MPFNELAIRLNPKNTVAYKTPNPPKHCNSKIQPFSLPSLSARRIIRINPLARYTRLPHATTSALHHTGDWCGASFALCAHLLQRIRFILHYHLLAVGGHLPGILGGGGRFLYAAA